MRRTSGDTLAEYRGRQQQLAQTVVERPLPAKPRRVAACDVHLRGDRAAACAVLFGYPDLTPVDRVLVLPPDLAEDESDRIAQAMEGVRRVLTEAARISFPYVPGLLAYREAPACVAAVRALLAVPDLVLVDGHGRAHPRRAGLACHVGVEIGVPTIGVAKSVLVGHHGALGTERGATAPLVADGAVVGMALRTRANTSPIYVSVGHLITLEAAVEWVLRLTLRYRLPEPSRLAHRLAKAAAAGLGDAGTPNR